MLSLKSSSRVGTMSVILLSAGAIGFAIRKADQSNSAHAQSTLKIIDRVVARTVRGGESGCCEDNFLNCPPEGGSICAADGTCWQQLAPPYLWVCLYSQTFYYQTTPQYKVATCDAPDGPMGVKFLPQITCGVSLGCDPFCIWDVELEGYACNTNVDGQEDKVTPSEPDSSKPLCSRVAKLDMPPNGWEVMAAINGIGSNPFSR